MIIPAFNEEHSIAKVIRDIPNIVREIIVVDNNSSDQTKTRAKETGATVLFEPRRGYGYACLKAMDYINSNKSNPSIIVFLDGDYSDYPDELLKIIHPIVVNEADLVIGSRKKALRAPQSMTPQQIFGNWLATSLMKIFFNAKYTDLGPFRAIKYDTLLKLNMQDKTYGWTVEMQLKALQHKIKYTEVVVRYRKRIGYSKVSGTLQGTVLAGLKIIYWILKYAIRL